MNRSLAVFVGFLMTLPAYAYDVDDYVTPASVAYVKGAYDALAGAAVTGAGTGLEKSATSPYTLGVKNGGIGATQLATSAVETAKIKDLNVTTGKLAANAVTNAKIADSAVTLGKIDSTAKKGATDTATYSGTGLTTQGYVDEKVAAAVSGLPIQDTNTTYASGTGIEITGNNNAIGIKSSGVTATQLATSAVTTDKINAGAVTSTKLATSAVVAAAISANAVTNAKIANSAVTLAKIDSTAKKGATDTATYSGTGLTTQGYVDEKVAAAVSGLPTQDTNTTYASGTGIEITGTNNAIGIKSSGVTATQLATSAVTADKINAGAVTSAKLATSAVTSDKINAGAVTSAKLATSAVTSDKINAGAVTSAKLATSAVLSAAISAGAVTLDKINSTAKQNASNSAYTSLTKLTTQGYVNEQIAGLEDSYQGKLKTENGDADIEIKVINDVGSTSADPDKSLATMGAIKTQIEDSIAGAGHQVQLKNNAGTPVDINPAVKTAISASSANASDSHLVTEKAIATALAGKQATLTSTNVTTTGTTAGTGAVVTGVSANNGSVTVTRANVQIPVGGSAVTNSYASIWIQ